ncbi:hypothetical protein RRG08_060006 [Elysia crispata]|uniref:Uncharacterized protein n=1 Tax=Elysia crispata TaxID=231223 RepID=A0AAE0YDS9_9GAST|nr:hypothetical protein RRG08_060006 [Elysia crispata]
MGVNGISEGRAVLVPLGPTVVLIQIKRGKHNFFLALGKIVKILGSSRELNGAVSQRSFNQLCKYWSLRAVWTWPDCYPETSSADPTIYLPYRLPVLIFRGFALPSFVLIFSLLYIS